MSETRPRPIDLPKRGRSGALHPSKPRATTMADIPVSRPARLATLACAGVLVTLAGCASVADDATTARTITPASTTTTDLAAADGATTEVAYAALPAAKPGTENTAQALPTPIVVAAGEAAGAVPVS